MDHVVIVGASLAGLQAAQTLRRADESMRITMVGDEPHLPYDRPPLSKHYLAGSWEEDKLRLRAAADPDALGLEWRLGTRATALDLEARTVTLSTLASGAEEQLSFDGLVIATGASPRRLPGSELDGVHVLRTLDDATGLKEAFDGEPGHVVVIGAGFIGAEVAATARERGLSVSMVEAAETPLSRVLPIEAGEQITALHRAHGVDVHLGVGATIVGDGGKVTGVALDNGVTIDTDVVVIGIGVVPSTDWLEGSGLTIDNGVVCDATCMAAAGVVVAGDVARWPNERFGPELTESSSGTTRSSRVVTWLVAWLPGLLMKRSSRIRRCRGSGAISTTARSNLLACRPRSPNSCRAHSTNSVLCRSSSMTMTRSSERSPGIVPARPSSLVSSSPAALRSTRSEKPSPHHPSER